LTRASRKSGDVWEFRFRECQPDGNNEDALSGDWSGHTLPDQNRSAAPGRGPACQHQPGTHLPRSTHSEDVKVVQELLRHGSAKITMDVYAQAVTNAKRKAQGKVVAMLRETQQGELCNS